MLTFATSPLRLRPEDIDWDAYAKWNGKNRELPGLTGSSTLDLEPVNSDRPILPEPIGRPPALRLPRKRKPRSEETKRRISEGKRRWWRAKKYGEM